MELAGGLTEADGAASAAAYLALPGPAPTAVTAFNDRCALGFIDTVRRAGLRVPEDVSVVGFDDIASAAYPHIGLTTVRQDADRLGALAMERVCARLDDGEPQASELVVPPCSWSAPAPPGSRAVTLTTALLFGVAACSSATPRPSIGGLASISIAIFAIVMPARESTAAILLLLIVGDVVAVWHYRRDADLSLLRRLIPAVLPGLVLGALFLAVVDDTVLRRSIGVLLLVMAALQLACAGGPPTPRPSAPPTPRRSAPAWAPASPR